MPLIKMIKTHADADRILLGGRYYNVDAKVLAILKADRSEGGCFQLITVKPKGKPIIHNVDNMVDPEDKAKLQTGDDYDSMASGT